MHDKPAAPALRLVGATNEQHPDADGERPAFQPTMHLDDIFRELIRAEIRNGRLSAWRRRRIVQYAAQLKLSAVEAGRLIEECRNELFVGDDTEAAEHALRLQPHPQPHRLSLRNIGFILAGLTLILLGVAQV